MRPAWFRLSFLALLAALLAFPLRANSIVPGQTVTPVDSFTLTSTPTILDEITGNFSMTVGTGTITGTYEDIVLVDPLGITCTGCLDFAISVSVNPGSQGLINTVFYGAWAGLLTNVGYVPGMEAAP